MNWRAISAMVRKDVTVALRSKAVALPLVIVPMLLLVGAPIALGTVVAFAERVGLRSTDIKEMNTAIPPALRASFANLSDVRAGLIFALVYLFAPMYLIMPLMVSSVVAADSFAGEKGAEPWRRWFTRRPPTANCCWPRCSVAGCRVRLWAFSASSSISWW